MTPYDALPCPAAPYPALPYEQGKEPKGLYMLVLLVLVVDK